MVPAGGIRAPPGTRSSLISSQISRKCSLLVYTQLKKQMRQAAYSRNMVELLNVL